MSSDYLIEDIVSYILPHLVQAGDYASEIQKRIVDQPAKSAFSDPAQQALTDADLSIQNFIEVLLLARFPEVCFYGEEYTSSLNDKYFLSTDSIEIWLDPIDGTLRYQKGHDQFSIIISFAVQGICKASIWYLPRLGVFYYGSTWGGIKQGTREDAISGSTGNFRKVSCFGDKIVTYKANGELIEAFSGYQFIDLSEISKPEVIGLYPTSFSEVAALVSNDAGVIDLMIAGKFLEWGGGKCTNFNGDDIPPINPRINPSYKGGIVAASSPELHKELLARVLEL
ncbi:MAG TPA: inositol monophosphatase family protein [Oligoflexia bacterium]|nr:inositol monophosphatase family protein [Oligoflexia bacterium]HMP47983.1 inositol monophosphatase family protein [Oligoflexia bacterium]